MQLPFTGGCACGAIRYDCTAEPVEMLQEMRGAIQLKDDWLMKGTEKGK